MKVKDQSMSSEHSVASADRAKKAAGEAAALLVEEGMYVGLGTGSTAFYFIEAMSRRCKEGLKVHFVASSEQTARHALKLNLPLESPATITHLDMTVDGADEVDPDKRMIKGAGGALFREKILALSSREMIVIVDESKLVSHLGKHSVPVEISPFMYGGTVQRLKELHSSSVLRRGKEGELYVTDNGNYIVDILFHSLILDPALEHQVLKGVLGVIETGLFFNIKSRVIVGYLDGQVKFF
jgi:ribose 5-phosphate isomerase A